MARQLDNTLGKFAHSSTNSALAFVGVAAIALLLVGAGISIFAGNWLISSLIASATIGVAVLAWLMNRQRRHIRAGKAAEWINWEAALPEVQRQNLNIAVTEISRILDTGHGSINDLRSAFIVAEDLALRQIQHEEQVPLMRHVSVASVPFDAVYTKDGVLVCVEAAFLVSPELRQERVLSMMRKIAAVNKSVEVMNIGLDVRLMVVIVTQMAEAEVGQLRDSLSTARFSSTPVDIDIRLLDFESLQRMYVTD